MPVLHAPAKINVTLEVLSRREDGYHTLRSVMLPIALYDRIDLEPAAEARFSTSDPDLVRGNLVERALAAVRPATAHAAVLEKVIPVGGGLGGGSSDAAAVLRAAMDGSLGAVADQDWLATARALGSDVPFFLCGTGALVEGTGERITPLGALPPWWTLVARPHAEVATGHAYRLIDQRRAEEGGAQSRPRSTSSSLAAVDAIQRKDFGALAAVLANDFHDVVLAEVPAVARADAALRRAGAAHVLLSGSGSCLFALFEGEDEARTCERRLEAEAFERTFVVPLHRDPAWR
jgi:4-diphosphocytidyl-2-C-methyl-D-erythritol kinase